MPLLDHFDLLAPYYDRVFRDGQSDDRAFEPLVAYLAPEHKHRLLDIGGGTGRIAQHFCGRVAVVCILDPSPGMLRQGQRKEICVTRGEAEVLPFADAVFERIMLIDAFHHLRDQEQAVDEMMRVLAPAGRLVVQEPNIAHWGVKLVAIGEKALLMRSRFYAPAAIQSLFASRRDVASVRVEPVSRTETGATAWVIVDKV
jgi:demethylmenaquinone methyltransferase/2-methoxy-6-polyprenyl-1,4-benzoquinol methylase